VDEARGRLPPPEIKIYFKKNKMEILPQKNNYFIIKKMNTRIHQKNIFLNL
jgi:hypothetical protein